MKTQHKSMLTHFITLLFVIFQFVQFVPSSLLSAITASAQSTSPVTLFSDDKGSGEVKWSINGDGSEITWNVTVNQAASETEASPVAEIKLPSGVGAPKIESATLNGNSIGTTFETVNDNHRFNPKAYSLDSQKLEIQFKTGVTDKQVDTLAFGVGGAIELVDTQASLSLKDVTIPNRLAEIEKERIAEEERKEAERIAAEEEAARIAEEERIAAEKAEAERLEAEQKAEEERLEAERLAQEQADKEEAERLAQEEADKKAEEERLATEKTEAEEKAEKEAAAAELEEEANKEDSIDLEEEQDVEEEAEDIELEVKAEEDSEAVEELDSRSRMSEEAVLEDDGGFSIMAAGDYSLTFRGYDPRFYDFKLPADFPTLPTGRANEPIPGANSLQTRPSLQPQDLALGQIVPFQIQIDVSGSTQPEAGVIDITVGWESQTTNNTNFGFDPAYGLLAAFVDIGDPNIIDPNNNATVESFSTAMVGSEIQGTFRVSGLDNNDRIIVELWVVLKDELPDRVGNNVQTRVVRAQTATGSSINVGNQTIPLSQVSTFTSVTADVEIIKTDEPDPIYSNELLTYTITVKNNSTTVIANGIVIEDTLDPYVTFVSASDGGTLSGADSNGSGGVVTWPAFALGFGSTRDFTLTVRVNEDAPTDNFPGTDPDDRGARTATRIADADITNIVRIASMITNDNNQANWIWQEPTNVLPRLAIRARKVWVGGPSDDHVAVDLTLSRSIDGENFEVVEIDGQPVITPELETNDFFDYVWTGLPQFDMNGVEYEYRVTEELEFDNYLSDIQFIDGIFIVTNTYESPLIDILARKVWDGGPITDHVAVDLTLSRRIEGGEFEVLDIMPVITPEDGNHPQFDYIWADLPEFDPDGNLYEYRVTEELELPNYDSDIQFVDGIFIVTNTYESPLIDILARKVWDGGPITDHVAVDLALSRRIEGGEFEVLDIMPEITPENGNHAEFDYIWADLPEFDQDGNLYEYDVTEDFVLDNYLSDIRLVDGIFIVTNTYQIPQLEIAGTKSWFNDTLDHRPGILSITLFRSIAGGETGEVITVEVLADDDGNWIYNFGEQDLTDFDGNVYTYFIEEEVPANYIEEYAAPYFLEEVLQLDVSNTLIDGDLYIIKADRDGNPITNNSAEFRLTRISPEATEGEEFSELFETDENGELVITGLLAGTYSLEETRAPSGFNLLPDDIIIVIEKGEDGSTIVRYGETLIDEENPLVIPNFPSQQLPDTGSMGTTVFTLIGLALMGGTVYGLKKNKKNTIKRSE